MSVRLPVVLCLVLVLVFALQCGGSGAGESNGDAGPASSGASGGNCGTRTGMRGKTTRSLMVDGTTRTYIAYLPQSLERQDVRTLRLRVPRRGDGRRRDVRHHAVLDHR